VFTGIIQATGSIAGKEQRGGDLRLRVDVRELAQKIDRVRLAPGESVAVNGACLTVVTMDGACFEADVSQETLRRTTLGGMELAATLNLEAALRAGDPLGGHLVTGHVDGIAQVVAVQPEARSLRVDIEVPEGLARYIAAKGSVTLDGVSLTVNTVQGRTFTVNLIPHTATVTTLREMAVGRLLNIEVDLLARYVERGLLHLQP
jgi:riboflavin synthase